MKKIVIGGKEYTLEYSIEASQHDDCIEQISSLLGSTAILQSDESTEKMKEMLKTFLGAGKVVAAALHAGLLKYHGMGRHGDKSIRSKDDVYDLLEQYFEDDPENDYYSLLGDLINCMKDDGFFRRTGMEKLTQESAGEN